MFLVMVARIGDKVRVKHKDLAGQRGIVRRANNKGLLIQIDSSNESIWIPKNAVTNYSLAARKAWKNMPKRQVGRPKGSKVTDRISVTLRINRDSWNKFRSFESNGLIEDRTAVINDLIEQKLASIEHRHGKKAQCKSSE